MTASRSLGFKIAVTLCVVLISLVGTVHMRAAFLPQNAALFARVPSHGPIVNEPLAVFGYMVFVVAILIVIPATGKMPARWVLLIGEAAALLVAAVGAVIAHGKSWPILIAVGVGAVVVEIVRRRQESERQ